jgi:hypothetical protein
MNTSYSVLSLPVTMVSVERDLLPSNWLCAGEPAAFNDDGSVSMLAVVATLHR